MTENIGTPRASNPGPGVDPTSPNHREPSGSANDEPVRRAVIWTAALAALGGLSFGYDTGVVSGVLLFLHTSFANERHLQRGDVLSAWFSDSGRSGVFLEESGRDQGSASPTDRTGDRITECRIGQLSAQARRAAGTWPPRRYRCQLLQHRQRHHRLRGGGAFPGVIRYRLFPAGAE